MHFGEMAKVQEFINFDTKPIAFLFSACHNCFAQPLRRSPMNPDVLSNLVITKVHSVSTLYTPEKVKLKRNDRPCWAVVIKYEGATIYTSNGKHFLSDINHIVLLPKGCSYDWECTKSGHYSIIEFESESEFCEPISFAVKHGERIRKMFQEMEFKRNMRSFMFAPESIKDTYAILLYLVRTDSEKYIPNSKQQKLQPVIEYISQNYGKSITNDTLAAISGMSTVYFRKLFTQVMGISPIAYTKQLRIEKAKEILKSDYGTLSDVAQSLGYSNLYDFSRDFKKHTGIAPSKYAHK